MTRTILFDSPFLLGFEHTRDLIERAAKARKERTAAAKAAAKADDPEDDHPFGGAGDDRYGRPPVPSNPQRMRVEPRL